MEVEGTLGVSVAKCTAMVPNQTMSDKARFLFKKLEERPEETEICFA
jgi:hypothetical protein